MNDLLLVVVAQDGTNWYFGTSLLAKLVILFAIAIVLGIIGEVLKKIFKR